MLQIIYIIVLKYYSTYEVQVKSNSFYLNFINKRPHPKNFKTCTCGTQSRFQFPPFTTFKLSFMVMFHLKWQYYTQSN